MNICTPKRCRFYKNCNQKKEIFLNNLICKGGEKYINQDFVHKKERTFSETKININTVCLKTFVSGEQINKKELIINLFFFKNKSPKEIKKIADCSLQYIYRQIKEAKKKIFKEK